MGQRFPTVTAAEKWRRYETAVGPLEVTATANSLLVNAPDDVSIGGALYKLAFEHYRDERTEAGEVVWVNAPDDVSIEHYRDERTEAGEVVFTFASTGGDRAPVVAERVTEWQTFGLRRRWEDCGRFDAPAPKTRARKFVAILLDVLGDYCQTEHCATQRVEAIRDGVKRAEERRAEFVEALEAVERTLGEARGALVRAEYDRDQGGNVHPVDVSGYGDGWQVKHRH